MTETNGTTKKPWRPAAAILRDMLADPERTIVCPGVYDGLTARIALDVGHDILYMVRLTHILS
jgi:2-methylisocitrate lyase-like PEP mutase family enzyme